MKYDYDASYSNKYVQVPYYPGSSCIAFSHAWVPSESAAGGYVCKNCDMSYQECQDNKIESD